MNKKLLKNAVCFLILLVLCAPIMVGAQDFGEDYLEDIDAYSGGQDDLIVVVTNVINVVLGLLALIAVIIVLIGGFEWMTAGGSDDKVATAKKRLQYGLIGLVIIFLAYAIVRFVLSKLSTEIVV